MVTVHGARAPRRAAGAVLALLLVLAAAVVVAPAASAAPGSVSVSKTEGLAVGETITVSGAGFDPAANVGTRQPLPGQPTGIYVMVAEFGDAWKPSESGTRPSTSIGSQLWVLPEPSYTTMTASSTAGFALLNSDGTFSVELTVTDIAGDGNLGVYTYAAGGAAANAEQETFTALALAGPTPEPEPEPEPETPITIEGGHLDWGVKQSFRSYITGGAAQGTITTAGGATVNADGTYRFPVEASTGEVADDGSTIVADFGGSVHFSGHSGALELDIADIVVTMTGATGTLAADVTSKSLEGGATETYTDVVLATLDLSGVTPAVVATTVTWPNIPAALTEAGVPAFSDFYTAGSALDPATVVLDLTEVPDLPSGGGSGDASVASLSSTTLNPGDPLTVSGFGFTPGEQVEVWLFSDPQWVGTATATEEGTVSYTFTLPADLEAGSHHVELRGVTSGHVATSPSFTVLAATAVPVSGTLPYTGATVQPALIALVLLLGGTALALVGRQRRRAGQQA
jgi:hypothetical protein